MNLILILVFSPSLSVNSPVIEDKEERVRGSYRILTVKKKG